MRIVLTNDDGYDAPGMLALWQALSPLPDVEREVIAPAESHSCKGHAFTATIRVRAGTLASIGPVRIVDGTPADSVCAAMRLPGVARPDWVVAGVNRGSNLGVDLYNSGTAAAARQAAIFGVPAIAISQLLRRGQPDNWPRTTREAAAILAAILTLNQPQGPGGGAPPPAPARMRGGNGAVADDARWTASAGFDSRLFDLTVDALVSSSAELGPGEFYNVNIPKLPDDRPITEVRIAPTSSDPNDHSYDYSTDQDGNPILTYTGVYLRRPAAPGTDVAAVFADAVSISRVKV